MIAGFYVPPQLALPTHRNGLGPPHAKRLRQRPATETHHRTPDKAPQMIDLALPGELHRLRVRSLSGCAGGNLARCAIRRASGASAHLVRPRPHSSKLRSERILLGWAAGGLRKYGRMCVFVYVCICVQVYAHMYMCSVCICVCVQRYIWRYVYIYICTCACVSVYS